jgi:hypothetical protein
MDRYRARRVLRADRRGSSWPVLIDTDAGVFHVKLRGAAQAPASLVAEVIVGALADLVGLSVPSRVLIELPADVPTDDRNDELADLLRASVGSNLGFQFLSDAREFIATDTSRVAPELASSIFWLDGLVSNPDRTAANPNLLWSHGGLWLIDHGACLGFQHDWPSVTERTPRLPWAGAARHLLYGRVSGLEAVDLELTARLDRPSLESAVAQVPDDFLMGDRTGRDRARRRAAFVGFLRKRLGSPRPFLGRAREQTR